MTEEEQAAWEMWKHDHPGSEEAKTWWELPIWVQNSYLQYLEAR